MIPTEKVSDDGPHGSSAPRKGPGRTFLFPVGFPVGLIVVALVALVTVPLLLRSRTDRADRYRTEVLQPARDVVNTIHLSLAREMGALRGFVITGDGILLDRYEEALEEERAAYDTLSSLAGDLPEPVAEAFGELRTRASRWHGRATEAEILERELVPREFIARLPSEEVRYEETLEAARRLRARIVEEVERDRAEIREMERASVIATFFLAILALAAALGALWLGRRLRSLAVEARSRQDELERVIAGRERLIRGVTHDLKNPLAAARGHIRMLRGDMIEDPEGRDENLKWTDRAIEAALDLIDDLLELSKAEAGELRVEPVAVDLSQVVRNVVDVHRGEAERTGLALRIEASEEVPRVKTDRRRVGEIVRNLVSNAVKFTPEGGTVTVRVRRCRNGSPPSDRGDCVAVDVIDTGPGIPARDRDRIFEEFSRVGAEGGRAGGSGLGLAISRRIARLLGGEIEVDSEPGRGSTFTLRLPPSTEVRGGGSTPVRRAGAGPGSEGH